MNSLGILSIAAPADHQLPVYGAILPDEQTPDVYAPIIKEISGDAYFAMGRWAVGNATIIDQTGLLHVSYENPFTDYIYRSGMHYLFINKLTVFPVAGVLSCDTGYFTQGTYNNGEIPLTFKPVSITGNATLYFDDTGAHFSINLYASMLHMDYAVSGDQVYASTIVSPSSLSYSNGSAVMVGEGGNGSYLLGGRYTITTDVGAVYKGMMVFRCL